MSEFAKATTTRKGRRPRARHRKPQSPRMPLQPPGSPVKDAEGFVPPPGTGVMPGIAALTTGTGKEVHVSSPALARAKEFFKEPSPASPTVETPLDPFATVRARDSPRITRSDAPHVQATKHEPPRARVRRSGGAEATQAIGSWRRREKEPHIHTQRRGDHRSKV